MSASSSAVWPFSCLSTLIMHTGQVAWYHTCLEGTSDQRFVIVNHFCFTCWGLRVVSTCLLCYDRASKIFLSKTKEPAVSKITICTFFFSFLEELRYGEKNIILVAIWQLAYQLCSLGNQTYLQYYSRKLCFFLRWTISTRTSDLPKCRDSKKGQIQPRLLLFLPCWNAFCLSFVPAAL